MHSLAESLDALREIAESRPVKTLAEAFAAAGHAFALVGAPVRDALLGRTVSDLDFTTSARPDETRAILETVASKTWDVGRAFGTIAARVHGETVEVTTYRAELYRDDSRKPEVTFGDTIEGDLVRRDFTINALALMLPSLKLVDVSGGVDDLIAGRIKTPGSAESSFTDDPLRMLRAARFSAQRGFVVEDEGRAAMVEVAARLEIVSAERIRDEPPCMTFSSAVRLPNRPTPCSVREMPILVSLCAFMCFCRFPSYVTVPSSCLTNPLMTLNSVVLPAPLGPRMPSVVPWSTASEIWSVTFSAP